MLDGRRWRSTTRTIYEDLGMCAGVPAWSETSRLSPKRALAMSALSIILAACWILARSGVSLAAAASPTTALQSPNILAAPTLVAHTADGVVGYRQVGNGSPLLLINGVKESMDFWPPSFVDSLASHFTVVVFDNAGVGQTASVGSFSVTAMADQTSALITTLKLRHPAVLGWSMGGMIAQALAVEHPAQVSRLVLAATQAGTGKAIPVPAAAAADLQSSDLKRVLTALFPPGESSAANQFVEQIVQYPGFYGPTASIQAKQNRAIQQWMAGQDTPGREIQRIRVPTLVADGALDRLDPTANDQLLKHLVRHANLVLYPDAGHAFLFQDASQFVPAVERFLG